MLPGGGINADNVLEIVQATGCRQVHIGASQPRSGDAIFGRSGVELCDHRFMKGTAYQAVSGEAVASTKAALNQVVSAI